MTISGPTGTGKTHMLEAIGRHWLDQDRTVRYEVAATMVDRVRRQAQEGITDLWDWWDWYQGRHLLLLDDLGLERYTPFAAEHLTRLVDGRLTSGLPLVVATNLDRDQMAEHLGDRIASRLYVEREDAEGLQLVTTSAADYRRDL